MAAYYNEFDPFAAAWLRELIKRGLIADGEVDDRSILEVSPDDLTGFTQCHFFAGIGVWSHALRRAMWPDERHVWTASCPCQPFSTAGKQQGKDDERHLWPVVADLIRECEPAVVFGEQVASKPGLDWFDSVQADMEAAGYACGAVDLCAAGVGAPHIRQRLYFVAERLGYADHSRSQGRRQRGDGADQLSVGPGGLADGLAVAGSAGTGRNTGAVYRAETGGDPARRQDGGVANSPFDGGSTGDCGPTNGYWRTADWLYCRDGKWRPVKPGTFPLADGSPARVGRLRGYGNAIVAPVAEAFITAYMQS